MSAWIAGLAAAVWLKFLVSGDAVTFHVVVTIAAAVGLHLVIGSLVSLYRQKWRVSSFREVTVLGTVWLSVSVLVTGGTLTLRQLVGTDVATSTVVTGSLITLMLFFASRVIWRTLWEATRRPDPLHARRTIVFGAGEGGEQVIRAMLVDPESQYLPVAILDDDPRKQYRTCEGVKVRGTREDFARVAADVRAEVVLVAIPSATSALISEMAEAAELAGVDFRVLPSATELLGVMSVADIRPPTIEDLLGRDPVQVDIASVSDYIRGKKVLVTGAGGSIGAELSRQVNIFGPSELFLLDRDETALHGVQLSMEGRALLDSKMLIVADIRDRERMYEIFDEVQPDVVFHAAALKHLTLLENHPVEGMKTNVVGTKNLLDAAMAVDVECFVNISTDKAADPTSVLGATKLAAERLTAECAARSGRMYVSARFGNVLGSRGSVLPTFLEQLDKGLPLTVTDAEATRYFMTIPEAVRLVVQAGAIGRPGEVMVLDMGEPVKIVDLATQLIRAVRPGTRIEFTGLRPGEKRHEVLMSSDEIGHVREHPRILHTMCAGGGVVEALAPMGADAMAEMRLLLARNSFDVRGAA